MPRLNEGQRLKIKTALTVGGAYVVNYGSIEITKRLLDLTGMPDGWRKIVLTYCAGITAGAIGFNSINSIISGLEANL